MSIQVKLKLKLTKIHKVIKVEYNTFQKITFDEYLVTSIVRRGKSKQEGMAYIDDITGNGSLNAHFKKLYEKIKDFNADQIERIMSSSMFPVLKKDNSNNYTYYPQIDASIYKNMVFKGDLINYENLTGNILRIDGEITSLTVDEKEPVDKSDIYEIHIDDEGLIELMLRDKFREQFFNVDSNLFKEVAVKDIENIDKYVGKIYMKAQGKDWRVLNKSAFENLFADDKYFYLNDEDHCAIIENGGVNKTEVAQLSGLYIYRTSYIPFSKDKQISENALRFLISKKYLGILKPKAFVELLRTVDPSIAIKAVNSSHNNITKETAEFAIDLLYKGFLTGWSSNTLNAIIKYCDTQELNIIYRVNNELDFTIQQLLSIDNELLAEKDRNAVDKYYADVEDMINTMNSIIGSVSTRGLRQSAKKLKQSDKDIKRFNKLCNDLLGHEERNVKNSSYEEIKEWHKLALELKELAEIVEKKLSIN